MFPTDPLYLLERVVAVRGILEAGVTLGFGAYPSLIDPLKVAPVAGQHVFSYHRHKVVLTGRQLAAALALLRNH